MKSFLKKLISLAVLIFFSPAASFSDTTSTRIVAPGVVHTEHLLPGPFTLDVIEVDLKNPLIQLESYRPNGLTRTSVQSTANDREGHRVIGAVNADFFSFETGWPVNNQVVNGKPVQGVTSVRSHLAVGETKKPYMEQFSFSGRIVAKNGSGIALNGINTTRGNSAIVLFTSFKGGSTSTDASGIECSLALVSPNWLTNDTLLFVVGAKQAAGNMAIPSSGAVLSAGSGASATFVTNNVFVNDTIKVYVGFNPATIKKIVQLIGGAGRILKNGINVSANSASSEGIGTDFVTARHPRTFAGFNADSSKFYLCTADGRQASSVGMSFNEMASFLSSIKVWDAFNLDGGGSTTMVVRGVVVNSPSDPGGERSVANSFQVISTAPTGTLSLLNITEERADVFQGNTFQFHAEGKDQYLNPLPLPAGVTWSADPAIGMIDNNGLLSAKSVNDSGWVRIQYNAASDSARVHVRVVKELRVFPQTLIMVPGERLTLSVRGTDSGNNKVTLQNNQVVYVNEASSLNVDAEGVVSSTGFGKGMLTVKLDTVTRSLYYNATGVDTAALVEDFHDTFNWKWDVLNTDPDNIVFGLAIDSIASEPAFKISYNFPPPSATVLMNTSLPLSSRVDSIFLRVYGDGGGHSLKLCFNDKEGQAFSISSPTMVNWRNEWRTVGFKLVNAVPVSGGTIDFPLALTQIQITIGVVNQVSGKAVGSIYLDDIKAHYPNRAVAPTVLYDFNTDVSGWLQPGGVGAGQTVGIVLASSTLTYSTDHPYEGVGCGKWTLIDDAASSVDWSVRIARGTTSELGSMLRGSYIGAWVWANGQTNLTLRTVIRDGNGQICQGPPFPVNHSGWKLIGTKLDSTLFTPYLTAGKITDVNNRFNGFKVEGLNSALNGQTRIFFVDKMVTSALTVPTGFIDFGAAWDPIGGKVDLHWGVNSEISVDRYVIERSNDGVNFADIGFVNAMGNIDTAKNYSYEDVTVTKGTTYSYRFRQITNDGAQELTPKITVVTTGAREKPAQLSYTYDLGQNFPNPFNPATHVRFSISNLGLVTLKIYDVIGKEVATLVREEMKPGNYTVRWDASDYPSGVYFSRLLAGNFSATRKLVLLK